MSSDTDLAQALRELFETWLESRSSFRMTVEVQAAWEGWKANTAVAAMLSAHESRAQPASVPIDHPSVAIGSWLSAALDDPSACDEFKRDIRAWFEAGQPTIRSASVGDYVTVPRELTGAMRLAGGHANSEWLNDSAPLGERRYAMPMDSVWKAMLAAAPQPTKENRNG